MTAAIYTGRPAIIPPVVGPGYTTPGAVTIDLTAPPRDLPPGVFPANLDGIPGTVTIPDGNDPDEADLRARFIPSCAVHRNAPAWDHHEGIPLCRPCIIDAEGTR